MVWIFPLILFVGQVYPTYDLPIFTPVIAKKKFVILNSFQNLKFFWSTPADLFFYVLTFCRLGKTDLLLSFWIYFKIFYFSDPETSSGWHNFPFLTFNFPFIKFLPQTTQKPHLKFLSKVLYIIKFYYLWQSKSQ